MNIFMEIFGAVKTIIEKRYQDYKYVNKISTFISSKKPDFLNINALEAYKFDISKERKYTSDVDILAANNMSLAKDNWSEEVGRTTY